MTASTVKSENVTNIEASPPTLLDRKKGRLRTHIDQIEIAATSVDEVADLTLLCAIPSNAVILDVLFLNADLDTHACAPALAANVGLYYSGIGGDQAKDGNTTGTVVDADCFASAATTFQAANTTWTSLRFEADAVGDVKKEAWEVAALTSDPGGLLYVGVAVTTAAATDGTGTLVCRVDYI